MKNILVAVTGGISAYKAVDVMSALKKNGYHVSTMATDSALQFVSENVLKITADKYWKHRWDEPIHINATDNIDIFAIVPATANIIAKIAHGIANDKTRMQKEGEHVGTLLMKDWSENLRSKEEIAGGIFANVVRLKGD